MTGGSNNNVNGIQQKKVNNFFNFTNPTNSTGRNSTVQQQIASQTSTGLSVATAGTTAVVVNGPKRTIT